MRLPMLYTAALAAVLTGCGAKEEPPFGPGEGSPWVEFPKNTIGVTRDPQRGEVVFQAEPCPNAQGRQAVALSLDGNHAYVGCWVDISTNGKDYVFVGWFNAFDAPGASPAIAAYKFESIQWNELGEALIETGKALQEAGK